MPGVKVNPKSDDAYMGNVTKFIKNNFKKRECNRFRPKSMKDDIVFCECGYPRGVHSDNAIQNESRQTEPVTETFPTDAFGYENFAEEKEEDSDLKTELRKTRYIRLDYNTDADLIWKLFREWKVAGPEVIYSIISTAEGNEGITKICRSIVEAAASTNGWIVTGGLDEGVDRLIGEEVKRRLARKEQIPKAVLGISHWGRLAKKEKFMNSSGSRHYASDENSDKVSLSQHHTHFLLVDDGTQNGSGCERGLRKAFEFYLTNREANVGKPLIYILIGGGSNELDAVDRALTDGIPVISAAGTGGAADTISKMIARNDADNEYSPEIFEELFNLLKESLTSVKGGTKSGDNFNTKTRQKQFLKAFGKCAFSDGGAKQLRDETKDDAVKRMRGVLEDMLSENEIPPDKAKQAVSGLEPKVLNETLTKIKLLRSIRNGLLIEFDKFDKKKTFTKVVVEALKKGNLDKPCDVYMLAANWDNEKFFKQLLRDEKTTQVHEIVLIKLLDKEKNTEKPKYFSLMMKHIVGRNWVPQTLGPLAADLLKTIPCEKLLKEINDNENTEDERHRKTGKMCFLWCVHKQMPETAMIFWKQGQDCLAMSLLAYSESKKLKNDLIDNDGYEKMEQQMEYFSKHSIGLLKTLYAKNRNNTHDLLVGLVEDLGGLMTPLQIADDANFEEFVCETPVQKQLEKIWINRIENPSAYNYVPMFLSGACPLLAPALLKFHVPSDDSSDEKEKLTTIKQDKFEGSYWWKVKTFINTPLVKFTYGFISYIGYLILFSVVMLTDFRSKMSPSEIALNIWTLILIVEEIRQVIIEKRRRQNEWHYFDIGALTIYIVGFVLRMIYHGEATICPSCLYVARIVLAFSLMIFFLRTLRFLSMSETLGPRIYMIRRLLGAIVHFMLILTVFISAYGVASNVILYPNQPLSGKLLQDVFYDAWWSLVLWFNLDDALGLNCNVANPSPTISAEYCSSQTDSNVDYVACKQRRCPANNWIVTVLLAFYVLLTVIMMLNVLIAIFTTSFSKISERQKRVSKMQRSRLIREYCSRSMVPPPLCVITYPIHVVIFLIKLCRECNTAEDDVERKQGKSKQMLHIGHPKEFAKILDSTVKEWERLEVEEYCERHIKEELRVAQMESEKDQTDKIEGTLMGKYIDKQIRNQIAERDRIVNQAENADRS